MFDPATITEPKTLRFEVFFPGCFKSSPSLSACFLRFMLKLAQKTKGVIVTNDNLRDLLDESPMYRDIIKKRYEKMTDCPNIL